MELANILVCEDERLVARDIEVSLKRNGYEVAGIASDFEQAMHIANDSKPDLALMDIRLRGSKSGIDIAGVLADEYDIPSIYLTAYADDETLEDAKKTLPLSYLIKPFDERELKTAIEVGLFKHREERRLVGALQTYIEKLNDTNVIEEAVELEREFTVTENKDSCIRIAGTIAEQIHDNVSLIGKLVEPVAEESALSQEQRESLRGAMIHQDRALQVIDRLVDLSKGGKLKLEESPIVAVIREAMSDAKQLLRPRLELLDLRQALNGAKRLLGQRVQFFDCLSEEIMLTVVDRKKVREALVNVFLNASEACSEESMITVGTSMVYEKFPERFNSKAIPGWYVAVRVVDDGRGMSKPELEHVFEPCYSTPANGPLHNGLGLCVIHTVMQQHLGWAHLESAAGMGTIVSLYFPSVYPPRKNGAIAQEIAVNS